MTQVSSEKTRRAIIAVGSNLGDSVSTIVAAVRLIELRLKAAATRSKLYETAPMYDEDQPSFVNGVISIEWTGSPFELLALLLDVEAQLGRVRDADARFGARTIDLDLVDVEDVGLNTSALQLPHLRCHERAFVLRPLVDIHPDWMHPRVGRSASSLLDHLESSSTSVPISWKQLEAPGWPSG